VGMGRDGDRLCGLSGRDGNGLHGDKMGTATVCKRTHRVGKNYETHVTSSLL